MDVATWLHGLGLQQYERAFRDNEIDAAVLPELTGEDLKDLGISLVGHRRKLLAAIAALRSGTTPAAVADTASIERRQLTVMFCDLVGSTALSVRRDPEDLRDLISAYHHAVAEVVKRFEGFVARYMGDGILIYFGYQRAHEDDAERAARCALAVVDSISGLNLAEELCARIGIATGMVVVGGGAPEHDVVGETPNLAARLQTLAEPNTVLIDGNTRRLIGGLFEYRDLGAVEARGLTGAVSAWQVLRPSAVASRFEAVRATSATPLVGRVEELEFLSRRWERAKKGDGQVVLLSGEPGIGKSRMTVALAERLHEESHHHLRYFCAPHHQGTALYPVITQLDHAAGFARDDSPAAKLEKLKQLFGQGRLGHLRRRAAIHAGQRSRSSEQEVELALLAVAGVRQALVADLLSLPTVGVLPETNLSPQQKMQKTLEALLGLLEDLSRRRPMLMVFEDAHWIDPTSRELLDLTIERISRLPVLLIITFRPEFSEAWSGAAHVSTLLLNRLDAGEGGVLAETVAGKPLPDEVVTHIAARTDGVPLFVEELTRAVLESGLLRDEGYRYALDRAIPSLAIPPSLRASLLARLDRLGPTAKEIAQIGAAIGRDFSYDLLAAVAQRGKAELQDALRRLVDAGLVSQRGVPPEAMFLFRHALVQDAAYETLLRGPRHLLHARIADAMLSTGDASPDAAPEIIAHHLQSADRYVEAVVYWHKAGDQAVHRAANREAITHYRRALSLIETLPDTAERRRVELVILSQLAPALMSVHGRSALEAGEVVERAAEVGRRLESSADLAPAIANLWFFNIHLGRLGRAEEISADLFRIARELGNPEVMLQAHHCAWPTRSIRGLLTEASEHIDAGLALYDEERHADHRHTYLGHDPAVCALGVDAGVQWALGHPERALRRADEAVALARRLRHAPSLAQALWGIGEFQTTRGDVAAVTDLATELLRLSEEHGLPQQRGYALVFIGWSLVRSGDTSEGIARLEEGLGVLSKLGLRFRMTGHLCRMAESFLAARQHAKGLERVARALDLAAEIGEEFYASRLYQVRAELLLDAHGPEDEAVEASLQRALALPRLQGAKGFELPVATRLARLWLDRSRRDAARDVLASVFGWFTEGFDTPDLKEAKALLDEMG